MPGGVTLTTKQDEQIEAIRNALAQQAGAMALADIEAAIGMGRRTLIRRLATMVELGLITKSGVSRGVRYGLAPTSSPVTPAPTQPTLGLGHPSAPAHAAPFICQPRAAVQW